MINSPSRLADDVVEFLLVGGRNLFVLEQAERGKAEEVLLRAERCERVVAYWRLRLLTVQQVWVLLLERGVEIHEGRNGRIRSVGGGVLRKMKS